jgi:hypothetical protein
MTKQEELWEQVKEDAKVFWRKGLWGQMYETKNNKMKHTTYQDLETNSGKQYLYGWLITYNPLNDNYLATNRDNYFKLFSDIENEAILKGVSHQVLEEIIILNQGDLRKIINWKKNFK